jgi:hypothetical protein
MVFNAVGIIAFLMALFVLLKVIWVATKRRSWISVTKLFYNRKVCGIVYAVLAAVILYYLLQEISIVQVFASLAFVAFLALIGFIVYNKDILAFGKKILAKRTSWVDFVLLIVWAVLAAWVIYGVIFV